MSKTPIHNKRLFRSLFFRMFSIVLMAFLPVCVFGAVINTSAYVNARKNAVDQLNLSSEYRAQSLENLIVGAMSSQLQFINNTDLLELVEESDYSYDVTRTALKVQSSLAYMQEISMITEDVIVYLPKVDMEISAVSGVDQLNQAEYAKMSGLGKDDIGKPILLDGALYVNVYSPMYLEQLEQKALVSLKLSKKKIYQILNADTGQECIGVLALNGEILEGSGVESNFIDALQRVISQYQPGEVQSFQANGKSYDLISCKTLHNGIEYYLSASNSYRKGIEIQYIGTVLLLLALIVLIVLFSSIWIKRLISRPIDVLLDSFRRMREGDLDFQINTGNRADEFEYLYSYFNETIHSTRQLMQEVYEDGIRLRNAEYKQLQYQINPHFLYNSLHIIYRMAKNEDYEGIVGMTEHLSSYYKFITYGEKGTVDLQYEVEHIQNYIAVQSIRFGDHIRFEMESLPDSWKQIQVPCLILQPIVENVYSHGLCNKLEDGLCRLSYRQDGTACLIIIEDNGDELTDKTLEALQKKLSGTEEDFQGSIGLINVHRRLQIRFKETYGLTLSRGKLGGLKVTIRIPGEEIE